MFLLRQKHINYADAKRYYHCNCYCKADYFFLLGIKHCFFVLSVNDEQIILSDLQMCYCLSSIRPRIVAACARVAVSRG